MAHTDDIRSTASSSRASDLARGAAAKAKAADGLARTGTTNAVSAGLVSGVGEGALRGSSKGAASARAAQRHAGKASAASRLGDAARAHVVAAASGTAGDDTDGGGIATGGVSSASQTTLRARRAIRRAKEKAAREAAGQVTARTKAGIVGTSVGDAVLDQLDESDELSGVGSANRAQKTARAAVSRAQARRTAKVVSGGTEGASGTATEVVGRASTPARTGASAQAAAALNRQTTTNGVTRASIAARAHARQRAAVGSMRGILSRTSAAVAARGGMGALAVQSAGGITLALDIIAAILVLVLLIAAISEQSDPKLDNLPEGITYDMVLAAVECQELYGHPAGATLTQIVVESSGSYNGLSALAAPPHNNLFGIKYWVGYSSESSYVTGFSLWQTQEDDGHGNLYTISAAFCDFASPRDCIYYRSAEFLQGSRYANNPLIQEAIATKSSDKMFEGLKDAGYATSSTYVEHLKSVCAEWNFYRFDGITVAELEAMANSGNSGGSGEDYAASNATQQAIADAAHRTPFAGSGWCAAWVSNVYANAGLGAVGGNACDMYWNFCTSSNKDELKVGMIVAVPHSPYGSLGWTYGHVGVYVGDNKIMHNGSAGIITQDFESWVNEYAYRCTAKWGFPRGGIA